MKAILKAGGLDPGPKRGEGTWDEFLKQHAASLWQCDFFSRKGPDSEGDARLLREGLSERENTASTA